MKKLNSPDLQFRLYPESKYLYFEVLIWRYKKDMMKVLRDIGLKGNCQAVCCSLRVEDCKQRLLPHMGTIHFYKHGMPYPTVIHELGHAAIEWGRRKGFEIDMKLKPTFEECSKEEESVLYALSKMCFDLFEKVYPEKVHNA